MMLKDIEVAKERTAIITDEMCKVGDSLAFFMCEHERGSQGYYQQFAHSCREKIKAHCPDVQSAVGHLHIGDFMWIIRRSDDEADDGNIEGYRDSLFTGVVIERKCLNDIITGSADINKSKASKEYSIEEARHFRVIIIAIVSYLMPRIVYLRNVYIFNDTARKSLKI